MKDFVDEHNKAMSKVPEWVRLCWHLYNAEPEKYPFGFSYHFPDAWNWKEDKKCMTVTST